MFKKVICLVLSVLIIVNTAVMAGQTFEKITVYTVVGTKVDTTDKRNEAQGADPVDLLTGNYDYKASDFSISGRGIGISFVRTYNSIKALNEQYNNEMTKPFGNGWNFNYNIRLVEERDGNTYIYHGDNRYKMDSPELTGTYGEPNGITYEFIQIKPGEKRISKISDIYGNTIEFIYSYDRLDKIIDTVGREYNFQYTSAGNISSISTPGAYRYRYEYDQAGRLVRFISPGGITRYEYDEYQSLLTAIYDPDGVKRLENFYDEKNRVEKQFYDGGHFEINYGGDDYKHDFVIVTERDGEETRYQIDPETSRPSRIISKITDEREYDEKGFHTLVNNVNYEYDAKNNVTGIEEKEIDFSLNLEYNHYDQVTSIVDALENQTIVEYDDKYLKRITDPSGVSTEFECNEYGQIIKVDDYEYYYDRYGHIDYIKDPDGNITDYTYDIMGRLTEVKDARGNRTNYEYTYYGVEKIRNNRGHSIVYDYDSKGNLLSARDTMINKELKYIYDQWDNLQRVVDPLGNSTEYEYNANEQVTAVRDSKDNKISYRYNAYNTVEEIKYTNPVGLNYTYEYDKYGRLLNEYDQSGNEISYQYYEDGSIKEAIDSIGNHTEYFYENGRIVKSEGNGVVTEYNYDSEGRIDYLIQSGERIEYEYNNLDQMSAVIDNQGRRIEYTYDEVGNIATMTIPGEGTFEYTYNDLNQVEIITTLANEVYTYTYDKAGRRTGLIYPNGKELSYIYDDYGRLEAYNNGIETFTYTYDKMNITGIETEEGKISYTYDKLDRLTGVSYPDGEVIKYNYDNAGNRTSKTVISPEGEEELISYTYDFSNRMIRSGNVRYEYDSKDRMVKKIDGEDTFLYSYNNLDQLISVTKNGIEVASFSYDLVGRRIAETINGETKEYLWSGDSLLAEYSGNTLDRLYAVGNGVDEVLGIYDENGTQYLHSNHVGSITGVTDESGNISGEKDYTPFGLTRNSSGDVDTELGFIGRKHYEEIGLTYIRARFYEPSSGRFITKDPVRDGFNWYSYCNGNPVTYVDWSGKEPVTIGIVLLGGSLILLGVWYVYVTHPEHREDISRALNDMYEDMKSKPNMISRESDYHSEVLKSTNNQNLSNRRFPNWGKGLIMFLLIMRMLKPYMEQYLEFKEFKEMEAKWEENSITKKEKTFDW